MASRKPKLKLSLNVAAEETNERSVYGINSPVADPSEQNSAIPEMTLNEEEKLSPASRRLRMEYGVNSPKANLNEEDLGGFGNVVTQVPQEEEAQPSVPAGFMTQVSREEAEQIENERNAEEATTSRTTKKSKSKKNKQQGGWCCFSGISNEESEDEAAEMAGQTPTRTAKPSARPAAGAGNPIPLVVPETQMRELPSYMTEQETEEDIQMEKQGLLGRRGPEFRQKRCLAIDLDETLVHSSFKPTAHHFTVPVKIEGVTHQVYVQVRPYLTDFLLAVGELYEVVLFTASLPIYADPLLDKLNKLYKVEGTIHHRLFRDSCVQVGYSYVKDLTVLGRKLKDTIIIDNSPASFRFQPRNAVPIKSWYDDDTDTELRDLIPVFQNVLYECEDVTQEMDGSKSLQWLINKGFARQRELNGRQ